MPRIFSRWVSLLCLLLIINNTNAQDTTWVQTFTFDSITTRRAEFNFPNSLNGERFEKVLMYYKLKCSPLTTWDQFNCGEWDYLTYTRVFDHTGAYDSVRVDSVRYLHNYSSNSPFDFEPWGYDYHHTAPVIEHEREPLANTTQYSMGQVVSSTASYPFDLSQRGGSYQMMIDHLSHTITEVGSSDKWAQFEVIILDKNKIYHKFNWQVEKYTLQGALSDCWMTTMVSSPIPLGSSI